jgi:hypothetical protein
MELCKVVWAKDDITNMRQALKENYYFEFVLGMLLFPVKFRSMMESMYFLFGNHVSPRFSRCKTHVAFFQLSDDLPVGGFIGLYAEDTNTYALYTHQDIHIVYNPKAVPGKNIVRPNLTSISLSHNSPPNADHSCQYYP